MINEINEVKRIDVEIIENMHDNDNDRPRFPLIIDERIIEMKFRKDFQKQFSIIPFIKCAI